MKNLTCTAFLLAALVPAISFADPATGADRQDLKADRKDLKADKKDLAKDRKDLREDRKEARKEHQAK